MPDPALIFVDLETSGLRHTSPAVWEAAWCVTDHAGNIIVPVRSRLCSIGTAPASPDAPRYEGKGDAKVWWPPEIDAWVRKTHVGNGLEQALVSVERAQRLDTGAELERLLLDAIAEADAGPAFLAGAGVEAFDSKLLEAVAPRLHRALHYRPVDASVMFGGLTGGREVKPRWSSPLDMVREVAPDAWAPSTHFDITDIDLRRGQIAGLPAGNGKTTLETWADLTREDNHRAFVGVLRAVALYRAIRWPGTADAVVAAAQRELAPAVSP